MANVKSQSFKKNFALTMMVLPGALWFLIFKYIPMLGIVIAFKDFKISKGGFFASVINSEWVGLKNFKFLFATNDAYVIIRNTVGYNILWLFLGLFISVFFAIMLNEIASKKLAKVYQTAMFFPFFLSWVVVSYFVFAFLSSESGFLNKMLENMGIAAKDWYMEPKYWPFILTFVSLWKGTGYNSVVYLAAICGIDKTYYEAAMIDGATKWEQIKYITIPSIKPMMIMMTILGIGRIFSADFGLFYNVPRNSGALYPVTNVIDTYVFRGLMKMGNIGMSTAAGLFQSLVGFVLILITNKVVNRIDEDSALF
ncbi:MAG: ABC transporter permease subunit [Xylanivirga thermophila]